MDEPGKKILIIDDEENITKLLETRLKANKYKVTTASNGREGLARLDKELPDLIILDIMMPVMDGFDFFKHIKKDPQRSKIPVLVLTARGGMRDTFEAMDADDFIAKPFDPEQFLQSIEKVFKKKVLLLCDDSDLGDKITKIVSEREAVIDIVHSEEEMMSKEKGAKYNCLIVYLGSIKREPKDFIMFKRMLRNRNAKLVVYSDVKASGSDNTVVVDEIKTKWERAGVDLFFDQVVSRGKFAQSLESFIV